MGLVLDEVTIEVVDISDGLNLQLSSVLQAIGGPGALSGKANADLSNVTPSATPLFASLNVNSIGATQQNNSAQVYGREAVDWINADFIFIQAAANGPTPAGRSNVADSDAARFVYYAGISAFGPPNTGVVLGRPIESQVVIGPNNNPLSPFAGMEIGSEFHIQGNGLTQLVGAFFYKSHGAVADPSSASPADTVILTFCDPEMLPPNLWVNQDDAGFTNMQLRGDGSARFGGDVLVGGAKALRGQINYTSGPSGYSTLAVGGRETQGAKIVLLNAAGAIVGGLTGDAQNLVLDGVTAPTMTLRTAAGAEVVITGPMGSTNQLLLQGGLSGAPVRIGTSGADAAIPLLLSPLGGAPIVLGGALRIQSWTKGTVPSASVEGQSAQVYVTDATAGPAPYWSDGSTWRTGAGVALS